MIRGALEEIDFTLCAKTWAREILTGDIHVEGNKAVQTMLVDGAEYEVTVRKIEPVDGETAEVLSAIPHITQWMPDAADVDNALVYIDACERLVIMPSRGGALFVELKDVLGDVAPFSD